MFRVSHDHHVGHEGHIHPVGFTNLAADALHNFVDGLLIGAAYLVSVPIGIATTVAVIAHEVPQELGDFGILLYAGFTKAKALLFNFYSALAAVAGFLLSYLLGTVSEVFGAVMLALTAGGFIYVAVVDLVPAVSEETRSSITSLLYILTGVLVMGLLTLLD
jgi:zinc and cadmium transporter